MREDDIKLMVHNALNNQDTVKFLEFIIKNSNCLDTSTNFENVYKQYYLQGKREFGYFILNLIKKYQFDIYTEILRKEEN